jgi:hypothetical protein
MLEGNFYISFIGLSGQFQAHSHIHNEEICTFRIIKKHLKTRSASSAEVDIEACYLWASQPD